MILVTSALGVFSPILMTRFTRLTQRSLLFVAAKQFGTGVILSTAFVHLFTHAQLMFSNECLGELSYEGTTAAIFLGGLFLSFLVDYGSKRFLLWRQGRREKHGGSADVDAETAGAHEDAKGASVSPSTNAVVPPSPSPDHAHGDPIEHAPTSSPDATLNVLVLETGIIFHSLRTPPPLAPHPPALTPPQ